MDLVTESALSLRQQVCKTYVLIELQTCWRAASLRHAMRVSSDAAGSQAHATRPVLGFLGGLSPLIFLPPPACLCRAGWGADHPRMGGLCSDAQKCVRSVPQGAFWWGVMGCRCNSTC